MSNKTIFDQNTSFVPIYIASFQLFPHYFCCIYRRYGKKSASRAYRPPPETSNIMYIPIYTNDSSPSANVFSGKAINVATYMPKIRGRVARRVNNPIIINTEQPTSVNVIKVKEAALPIPNGSGNELTIAL